MLEPAARLVAGLAGVGLLAVAGVGLLDGLVVGLLAGIVAGVGLLDGLVGLAGVGLLAVAGVGLLAGIVAGVGLLDGLVGLAGVGLLSLLVGLLVALFLLLGFFRQDLFLDLFRLGHQLEVVDLDHHELRQLEVVLDHHEVVHRESLQQTPVLA